MNDISELLECEMLISPQLNVDLLIHMGRDSMNEPDF